MGEWEAKQDKEQRFLHIVHVNMPADNAIIKIIYGNRIRINLQKLNILIIRNGVLMIVDYIRKKTTYIRHFPHFNQVKQNELSCNLCGSTGKRLIDGIT